jgi:uncharacterized protein (DUF1697 family)
MVAGARDKYVAFLRAINVGGHNRVAMADLRELLGGLGYDAVRTHLQSGNAVFAAPGARSSAERLTGEIEGALARELGVGVKVLVRTHAELERAIAANPLLEVAEDHARLLVTFLSRAPAREALDALAPAEFEPDVFAVGEREIYTYYPQGVRATKLSNAFWERRLGVVASARNWNTVTRLLELMQE